MTTQTTSDIRRAAIEAGIPWDSLADLERANYCSLARCLVKRWREERAESRPVELPPCDSEQGSALCAGCGGHALEIEHSGAGARVWCTECGTCGPWDDTPGAANEAWDRAMRRAAHPGPLAAELAEVYSAIQDECERRGWDRPATVRDYLDRLRTFAAPAPSGEVDYEATPDCTCSMDGGAHAPGCGYGGWAGRVNNVDAGGGEVDYEAALKTAEHASVIDGTRDRALIRAGFAQGARSRLTPEELRAIGDAVDILEHISRGGEIGPGDDVLLAKATPVLRAIAGRDGAK